MAEGRKEDVEEVELESEAFDPPVDLGHYDTVDLDECRQMAAQCWCTKGTENIIMDPLLAEAFARRLSQEINGRVEYWEARWEDARSP